MGSSTHTRARARTHEHAPTHEHARTRTTFQPIQPVYPMLIRRGKTWLTAIGTMPYIWLNGTKCNESNFLMQVAILERTTQC
jgi:hypothetical protein